MKHQILFVEDQPDLGNVVKQYLEIMNFEIDWIINGREAFEKFRQNAHKYDILLIDIQLPEMDGFELAGRIAQINDAVPFLFLTARNEKKDRIRGLKIGADDYISKPFDIDELVLRIKNIIRRNKAGSAHEESSVSDIVCGDFVIHKDLLKFSIGNKKNLSLTQREAELLEYLCKRPNRVLKREEILLQLWGENDYFLGRSLDVFISRLRKLLQSSKVASIDNVYGIGFIFNVKQ